MGYQESERFVKYGEGAQTVAALQAEAELLRFAAHPGVVEVVGSRAVPTGWELALRRVPGPDLTGAGPWTADELAGYGAAVATTLADLHDIGMVHGRLAAEHLLVDDAGRPVICGFGQARRCLGEPAADLWKAADVADLARCLSTRRPAGAPRALARALDRASAPARRSVDARQLARLLRSATASPTLPQPARPDEPPALDTGEAVDAGEALDEETATARVGRPRRRPAGAWRAAAGLSLLAAVVVTFVLVLPSAVRAPSAPHRLGLRRPGLQRSGPQRSGPQRSGSQLPGPPPRTATRAPAPLSCPAVDDGCGPLPSAGGVVTLARGRFRIGRSGDVVVLGRWTCTRTPLAALLRPADGRVWVFPRWASQGGATTATLLARVPGAHSLRTLPGANDCDRVEVLRRSGPPIILAWRSTPAPGSLGGHGR